MKLSNKPLWIGLFLVVAILMFVTGIAMFGTGQFFSDKYRFVLYFNGSVKGLRKGSPVAMKGVAIGAVQEINLIFPP